MSILPEEAAHEHRRALALAVDREAVHTWFGLSYANYLVLPRSVLQSMPPEWQVRFVAMLDELNFAFGHLDYPPYDVRVLARSPELLHWTPCNECEGEGKLEDGSVCPSCKGEGEVDDEPRYETAEEVGFITDPIPHYNRGRTRLEASETPRV